MARHQQIRHALGSQAILTIIPAEDASTTKLFTALWEHIDAFEDRFSRFRTNSELTLFNASAGQKQPVSPPFHALLKRCQQLSTATQGVFNPFVLPALQKAGYIGSWPQPTEFDASLDYSSRTHTITADTLELGPDWARIPANSAFDFGGIGKGYLLDELGDYLRTQGVTDFWLSLGGDILCQGYDVTGLAWSVAIQHATKATDTTGQLTNNEGNALAIATSGTTKRRGITQGRAWHHLIDPRTGLPAKTDITTATATAILAVEADVYAKCAVILGSQAATKNARAWGIQSLQLQLLDGTVQQVKIQEAR